MSIINEIASGMTLPNRIITYIGVVNVQQLLTSINKDTAKWIVYDDTKQIISMKSHGDSSERLGW